MLFELRNTIPEVSSRWVEARDLFLAGKVRNARDVSEKYREPSAMPTANDHVLNIEIARACGAVKRYLSLVRLAHRAFPHDPIIQLYNSRMLQTRGRHYSGVKYLLGIENTLGTTHRAWWGTQLANLFADAGFSKSADRWMRQVEDEPQFDSPLALYSRTCALDGMQHWDPAIELAERCVASAPLWIRARVHLVNCLLARGRLNEAQDQFRVVRELGHEESYIDFLHAMLHCALGEFERSAHVLQTCLETWPDAEFVPWARHMLYVLHIENGRYDEARCIADSYTGSNRKKAAREFGLPSIDEIKSSERHKFLPIPLVVQNRSQCVPTTVAMATYPQGHRLNPEQLYQAMHGRDGTPLWRMRNWVNENGLTFVPVQLEKKVILGLLDRGLPLIGILEGAFSSHVDVICGYHDALEVFYVRDPAHWGPMIFRYETCLDRYALHNGLIAVIDKKDQSAIDFANQWHAGELAGLLDLQQACFEGDRVGAEAAAARIGDNSILAFQRDLSGVNVVCSNRQFTERMTRWAKDPEANGVARFRAMMCLDSEASDPIIDELLQSENKRIGTHGRLFVQMLRNYQKGNWQAAYEQLDRLLIRGSGIMDYWSMKCDVLSELGRHDESQEALEMAMELSPGSLRLREKALSKQFNHLTYHEYETEIEAMIAENPDERQLLWGRVIVRRDGPDGLAFEAAVDEYLQWFPRDVSGYFELINWYLMQGRQDLADTVRQKAQRLLPDEFSASSSDATVHHEPPPITESNSPLPEQHGQLLDILWNPSDTRRQAAWQKLNAAMTAGQLKWTDHGQLISFQIGWGWDDKPAKGIEVTNLLPIPTPGPTYWYVNGVLETLSRFELATETAHAVLEWIDQAAPEFQKYANLWFNRILIIEQTGQMEDALVELRALLDMYPAFSSALYRMGVVKHQQGDYRGAASFFQRALQVNPGLYGAIDNLCTIHSIMENQEGTLEFLGRIRKKMPYYYEGIRDEVFFVAETQGHDAARKHLDKIGKTCSPLQFNILEARLAAKTENVARTEELVDHVLSSEAYQRDNEYDETVFEELLHVRLSLAMQKEDTAEIDKLCSEGIQRWPDSTRIRTIQAEYGTADKQSVLREMLVDGIADSETAYRFLKETQREPLAAVVALVGDAAADNQQRIAELISEVTGFPDLIHLNLEFLNWSVGKFPESTLLKYRLAEHCSLSGDVKKATDIARELHGRDPHNLELLRFYGRVLMDSQPEEALQFLRRACKQNRTIEYLFDLARCYQLLGDATQSCSTHLEILQQNPYVGASVTNLYFQSEEHDLLWPLAKEIVRRGGGVSDEYFLVAAVKLAISQRDQMPEEWHETARERTQVLQTHPGFLDEKILLAKALKAWGKIRPEKGKVGRLRRMLLALEWPGAKWIPQP